MPMTPVKILSDTATSEPGRSVATVAIQGYERYAIPVTYWTELKNDPVTGTPPGYGPLLGAKWLAKEVARVAPALLSAGLKKLQDKLAATQAAVTALPAPPAAPDPDSNADRRAALQAQITSLQTEITTRQNLQAIVDADAVPRINDFYDSLVASLAPTDPRVTQYRQEQAAAVAAAGPAVALPATI